jgi:flagellar biosynthesis/type III secretory pathway protein FliH
MPEALTVNVATPIASVNTVDNTADSTSAPQPIQAGQSTGAQEKQKLDTLCKSLEKAAAELKQFQQEIFTSHREQIAQLSVKIAEKILLKEIEAGKYEISNIIQEALKTVSGQKDIVVRVNSNDLEQLSHINDGNSALANIKLKADPNIGPANCILETDRGMIEYCIEEHLKQVAQALKGTE